MPLLRRMAVVLRAGEKTWWQTTSSQSQRLGEEARKLIDAQRRRQAKKVVERFQWIGAVVSVTPLPVVDLLASCCECSDGG